MKKVWATATVAVAFFYFVILTLLLYKYSHLFMPDDITKLAGSKAHAYDPKDDDPHVSLAATENGGLWYMTRREEDAQDPVIATGVGVGDAEERPSTRDALEEGRRRGADASDEEELDEVFGKLAPQDIRIEVTVGKWSLLITADGRKVVRETMALSDVRHMRKGGLYLTVLHQATADLMHSSRHRTFEVSGEDDLWRVLLGVQPGRIVILAAMHEGFMQVSEDFLDFLRTCGSLAAKDMTMGDRWAWIWTKGGRTWAEGAVFSTHPDNFVKQAGPVRLQVQVPRSSRPESECETWPREREWHARREFCQRYEGYGDLCSCERPRLLTPQPSHYNKVAEEEEEEEEEVDIPTVVVASQRPLCLDRCLRRLTSVSGGHPRLTLVVADGDPDEGLREVRELVSLYGMKFIGHDAGGNNVTLRITRHYKKVMESAFSAFPKAREVIILEEDLYVASDFYRFFAQTAPLLEGDHTLYCISAWNDLGQAGAGGDPALVMRSETMAGLGWLLSRRIYEEIIPKWPAYEKFTDWDMWMRLPAQQRGRECLVPEVSRTFHYGTTGAHLTAYFQSTYYANTSFNTRSAVRLRDLHRLGPETYDALLQELLEGGKHLNGSDVNPCSSDFLPRNSTTHHILWIKMNEMVDDYTVLGVLSSVQARGFGGPDALQSAGWRKSSPCVLACQHHHHHHCHHLVMDSHLLLIPQLTNKTHLLFTFTYH
ncbi:protein O-linked-mannose beta-1,2-N-acetylglucosaminyltransferase 1-like isoform X2 [Panulirus ornatus]|uniref:protein O-linked-mannose beta-1,2-N-acetylglucosaminyltransferase 1-like isoform X2 n=1 Tax=Panulirus ornatus TaxID=150431 RepID=UPI003A8C2AEC